ncbi:glutaminyl-peptide cyclotransferase [Undibacterium sp. Ji83W]|uniref:glutaminyl-peptide cyclotransferase n=1 Tax=Undibacterium sp. Ji83W TaxID=3413043 RepID=UPI003BEF749B
MRKWKLTGLSASLFSGVLSGLLYIGIAGGMVFLPAGTTLAASAIPSYTYEVVHAYPHDPNAFTQGLFIKDGFLFESTGLQGRSTVRKVRLETGEVLQKMDLPRQIFGEGITWWDKRIIGITWTTQAGYVLDLDTFAFQKEFAYKGEGWGLARNDKEIIMSDGTAELRFLDPLTLRETHRIKVTADGKAVDQLNELEWVKGEIFANIWQTDMIARIDPKTGKVIGWINLNGLLPMGDRIMNTPDVLNGIAYDAAKDRLFVTGKLWPKLFEIRLIKR